MKRERTTGIWLVGIAEAAFGLVMALRTFNGLIRMLSRFSVTAEIAGILPSIVAVLHPAVYLFLLAGAVWLLFMDERGRKLLMAAISVNLAVYLFSMVRYWNFISKMEEAAHLHGGTLAARSSIIPVYIIFILQIAALCFISRPAVREHFE